MVLSGTIGILATAACFYKSGGSEKRLHTNAQPPRSYLRAIVRNLCLSLDEDGQRCYVYHGRRRLSVTCELS